jgi:ubiquinone/menaquinone biosynthesis C-methylase UbiE
MEKHSDNKVIPSSAEELHHLVPPDWYERSVRENLLQKYWHFRRIQEVGKYSEKCPGDVLDIGSADGYFTRRIFDFTQPKKIIGIDVLQTSVSYATKRYSDVKKMTFKKMDGHRLLFKTKSFAAVYILEALEHVFDARKVLSEILRVLVPGGYVIVLVPSENWLFRLGWPIWTHTRGSVWHDTHLNFFDGAKLPGILSEVGFTQVEKHTFIMGMLTLVKARKSK